MTGLGTDTHKTQLIFIHWAWHENQEQFRLSKCSFFFRIETDQKHYILCLLSANMTFPIVTFENYTHKAKWWVGDCKPQRNLAFHSYPIAFKSLVKSATMICADCHHLCPYDDFSTWNYVCESEFKRCGLTIIWRRESGDRSVRGRKFSVEIAKGEKAFMKIRIRQTNLLFSLYGLVLGVALCIQNELNGPVSPYH